VLYRKTFESPFNVDYHVFETTDPCTESLTYHYLCWWGFVDQYNPPANCPVITTEDPFKGVYSLKMSVMVTAEGTPQRCEIRKLRKQGVWSHDYYHLAFKLEDDWGEVNQGSGGLDQVGYQWINAAPIIVSADDLNDSVFVIVASGACAVGPLNDNCQYYSGQPIKMDFSPKNMPGPLYIIPPGKLQRGVWHEIVYHVYWTPDANGIVEGWWRVKGETSFTKTLSIGPPGQGYAVSANFPTLQTGTNDTGQVITRDRLAANDPTIKDSQDKFGQYIWGGARSADAGYADAWFDSWCRATSFEAATSC
jgi:hypothetical protein